MDKEVCDIRCDCLCEVVEYNSIRKGFQYCYWPECAKQSFVSRVKLYFDIEAGRTYKGSIR
jgi:hypothetical protein